jgi:hypothetical protein
VVLRHESVKNCIHLIDYPIFIGMFLKKTRNKDAGKIILINIPQLLLERDWCNKSLLAWRPVPQHDVCAWTDTVEEQAAQVGINYSPRGGE